MNPRLNRLFRASGKCLDVAIDHGVFNEYSFLDGLENIEEVVRLLVGAAPDAIQMNYGQADVLQRIPGREKPALVMRIDCGNTYNAAKHSVMFDILAAEPDPVLPAVKMDAACVVCNLILMADEPELHRQTISNIARIRPLCEQYGMPLMIEPLVMRTGTDKKLMVALVRQARELGADVIKADMTEQPDDYAEVLQAARCPVLVRGGGREDIETVFRKAHAFLSTGAHGLVYGRNIYQHPDPARIVRAFMGMIHEGWTAEQALTAYRRSN